MIRSNNIFFSLHQRANVYSCLLRTVKVVSGAVFLVQLVTVGHSQDVEQRNKVLLDFFKNNINAIICLPYFF